MRETDLIKLGVFANIRFGLPEKFGVEVVDSPAIKDVFFVGKDDELGIEAGVSLAPFHVDGKLVASVGYAPKAERLLIWDAEGEPILAGGWVVRLGAFAQTAFQIPSSDFEVRFVTQGFMSSEVKIPSPSHAITIASPEAVFHLIERNQDSVDLRAVRIGEAPTKTTPVSWSEKTNTLFVGVTIV